MDEYICKKCHTVFSSKSPMCCGEVEDFSPEKHAASLVSASNTWIQVWEKWKDNPLLRQVSEELASEGCYSAASCLNEFIDRLIQRAADGLESGEKLSLSGTDSSPSSARH